MWNPRWGGLPPQDFLSRVDPLFAGIRDRLVGPYGASDETAGVLTAHWAERLGLRAGIPIATGGFDAHWDALGAGCRIGDVVNVVGTSTCIIAMGEDIGLIPGVCGVVPGSVDPRLIGIEAGLSATGDIFEAIARRAGTTVSALSKGLEAYRPGQTGLMRMTWDNGDRTVLVKSDLGGMTLGWSLVSTAQDELFAAIEGTAFHTRIILDHLAAHGVPVQRIINGGGLPQRNQVLNQVYADVLGKPVLVPDGLPTGLGSAIFAGIAAGTYRDVPEAQDAICLTFRTVEPNPASKAVYDRLYGLFRDVYFGFGGQSGPVDFAGTLKVLKDVAGARLA
jgi:L-ribulokinase